MYYLANDDYNRIYVEYDRIFNEYKQTYKEFEVKCQQFKLKEISFTCYTPQANEKLKAFEKVNQAYEKFCQSQEKVNQAFQKSNQAYQDFQNERFQASPIRFAKAENEYLALLKEFDSLDLLRNLLYLKKWMIFSAF